MKDDEVIKLLVEKELQDKEWDNFHKIEQAIQEKDDDVGTQREDITKEQINKMLGVV